MPWHSMEHHAYSIETPWDSMELHGYSMDTPWTFLEIPWISIDFHGFPQISMEFHGGISHGMVQAFISAKFCQRLLCQFWQALSNDSSHLSTLKILRQIIGVGIKVLSKMKSKEKVKSLLPFWALHLIILASKSGCNRSDIQTPNSSIGQSPKIPREFFPCQLEPQKINPSNKSGRAIALPDPPPPRSLISDDLNP